jgi:hypothetical protein
MAKICSQITNNTMTLYQAKENSSHDVRGAPDRDRSTGEWWRANTRFAGKTPKLPSSKQNAKGAFGGKRKKGLDK